MRAPRDCHDQRRDRLFFGLSRRPAHLAWRDARGRGPHRARRAHSSDRGFGSGLRHDPKDMAETVKAAIEAGAIGMNLEDVTVADENSPVADPLQPDKT